MTRELAGVECVAGVPGCLKQQWVVTLDAPRREKIAYEARVVIAARNRDRPEAAMAGHLRPLDDTFWRRRASAEKAQAALAEADVGAPIDTDRLRGASPFPTILDTRVANAAPSPWLAPPRLVASKIPPACQGSPAPAPERRQIARAPSPGWGMKCRAARDSLDLRVSLTTPQPTNETSRSR